MINDSHIKYTYIKFIYSEKAKKLETIYLTLLRNIKRNCRIFQIFVVFLKYTNFTEENCKITFKKYAFSWFMLYSNSFSLLAFRAKEKEKMELFSVDDRDIMIFLLSSLELLNDVTVQFLSWNIFCGSS